MKKKRKNMNLNGMSRNKINLVSKITRSINLLEIFKNNYIYKL